MEGLRLASRWDVTQRGGHSAMHVPLHSAPLSFEGIMELKYEYVL